ncbi:hypothetical protein MK079_04525, partial [Candidatus Gracilibacteria bacterium]|nr:hypothetical protein [Candidatus Gracilibacteria bacterium]
SRELFFEKIGIDFPDIKEKYHKEKIQEFYGASYKLYTIAGKEFFEKLNLEADIFKKNNLPQLTFLFHTIIHISSILSSDKYILDINVGKVIAQYEFHKLCDEIDPKMLSVFSGCSNIKKQLIHTGNIENIGKNFSEILMYIFQKQFHIKGNDITPKRFYNTVEKWGNIDVIYTLFSHFSGYGNEGVQKILSRITETILLESFHEYKYNGYQNDSYDKQIVQDQIGFLNENQKKIWKNNTMKLHHYSGDMNKQKTGSIFDEMYEVIQNGFIDNKHLDELSDGYTEKIIGYSLQEETKKCRDAIRDKMRLSDIIKHFPSLDPQTLLDIGFVSLIEAKNEEHIITGINFVNRVSTKYGFDISKIKPEFNMIFEKKKILQKNISDSLFFTYETDNPKILLEIGNIVPGDHSCQNYKGGSTYLSALPGYVIDAGVKALLSFEINRQNLKNPHEWDELKKYIQEGKQTLRFDPYTLCLKVNNISIQFRSASYRNILKLGENHESPVLFLEKGYSNLPPDKKQYIVDVHNTIKENKLHDMNGDIYANSGVFPESRNPGGIYVDAHNSIAHFPYTIKF